MRGCSMRKMLELLALVLCAAALTWRVDHMFSFLCLLAFLVLAV